jgi:hypothetical protein
MIFTLVSFYCPCLPSSFKDGWDAEAESFDFAGISSLLVPEVCASITLREIVLAIK